MHSLIRPWILGTRSRSSSDCVRFFTLISKFKWANEDQDLVAAYITDQKMSDDAAAKKWLDANPDKWKAWLP